MSTQIEVYNPDGYVVNETDLRRAAQAALDEHSSLRRASLSIVIISDAVMRELNQRHRQTQAATDVLSFAALPLPEAISQEYVHLGDVVIAHQYAAHKAAARGARLEETLCLLVIHGTLHLLGFTHDTDEARRRMWQAQAIALGKVGINQALVEQYETVQPA